MIRKMKYVVAVALALSAFVIGNLLLLGTMHGTTALVAHFAFVAALLAVLLVAARGIFKRRDLIIGSAMIVLIALSTVQFASALHAYERASAPPVSDSSLQSQIAALQAQNKQYNDSISYLSSAITTSQQHAEQLRARISELYRQENAQQAAAQPVQQTAVQQYREREEPFEDGESDD